MEDALPSEAEEVIEVRGAPVAPAGTISLDARVARQTAGALGEPFRVLALLPGVTTSIAASGAPIVRGTLPGESRFTFDGIELPLLYHFLLGNQVIHPAFLGDLTLRAGGYGAEHGRMLGGLVELTPAAPAPIDRPQTELHANLLEVGAFHARQLTRSTSIAAAARIGTLAAAAKIYDADAALYYLDQQVRLVHRLGNGDELTLTSLASYDYLREPPSLTVKTTKLGFHRLDLRWSRGKAIRAGVQTELDSLRHEDRYVPAPPPVVVPDGPPTRTGGGSYGIRAYADVHQALASWLTVRGGVEAHARALNNGPSVFSQLTADTNPLLAPARRFDTEGAWTALDLRVGPVVITPGVRVDRYHAAMTDGQSARHAALDPRLAITAELPNGGRVELSGGAYSAPPQISVFEDAVAIGPLPTTEGSALTAGLSHGYQGQASVRTPLGANLEGSFAAYYRDTRYAIDFAMLDKRFRNDAPCDFSSGAPVYRDLDVRALGVEAMVRGKLGAVTGWLSYSLGKADRDLGFVRLPHDYDQRHTLNATAQWTRGAWTLGATGHLHTGRPLIYPDVQRCAGSPGTGTVDGGDSIAVQRDPTQLRRPAPNVRLDLRAERTFQLSSGVLRLYFEMQNATLSEETIDYSFQYDTQRVEPRTLLIPLPVLGVEVQL